MARCIICNYCSDIDGKTKDNYMEEGYDTCIKCASVIETTLEEYGWDDNIDATGVDLTVQGDPEVDPRVDTQEKEEPSLPLENPYSNKLCLERNLCDVDIDTYCQCASCDCDDYCLRYAVGADD